MSAASIDLAAWDRALLEAAEDPFAGAVAQLDVSAALPPDVASLHAPVRTALAEAVATAASGRPAMVLVKGDPGQGKTHEIAWLRERERGRAHVVSVPPLKDPGAPFSHVLRHVVLGLLAHRELEALLWSAHRRAAVELARRAREDGDTSISGAIESLLAAGPAFPRVLRAELHAEPALAGKLAPRLRTLPPWSEVDPDFARVLSRLLDPATEPLALEWLRGAELPDQDLGALGVRRGLDGEARAFEVLRALCRIAERPLVVCFDQLESTSGLLGLDGMVVLFTALMELYQELPLCLVLMCQTSVWAELRARLPQAALDRLRELLPLPLPTGDDAAALVAARLAPLYRRAGVVPPYPSYPFSREHLRDYARAVRPTLRRVLVDAGGALAELRREGRIVDAPLAGAAACVPAAPDAMKPAAGVTSGDGAGSAARPGELAAAAMARAYARAVGTVESAAELASPVARQDRLRSAVVQVLQSAAQRTTRVAGIEVLEVDAPSKPRVGPRPPMVVSLLDPASGRRLRLAVDVHGDSARGAPMMISRLQRRLLDRQADAGVLLREAEVAFGEQARRTHELLSQLGPAGGVEYLSPEAVRRLVAADLLLDAVASEEVVAGGHVVERREALAFLVETEAVGEALAPLVRRTAGTTAR